MPMMMRLFMAYLGVAVVAGLRLFEFGQRQIGHDALAAAASR